MNSNPLSALGARTAIVLGSGLGPFADAVEHEGVIPYESIPDLPVSSVPGHAGRFVLAKLEGTPLVIAQGRVHLYEGWDARDVVRGISLLREAGIRTLILTNAAGTVNAGFPPGTWMMLSDHINLTGQSPLRGGPHFVDLTEVYSNTLRETFREAASRLGVHLHEGVYAAMPGPQYETPAEIRMLQRIGADAVGMSTVPEAIQARALGMEVAAFSCLTNWGAGLSGEPLSHEEVTGMGRAAAADLIRLLRDVLPRL
ncbi:MAG: purine-nucleoside phosphorylase [Terrimicrobiaceae bacterium]|nr:purine-nucleoside phosphorylase [Terrimicrobiaceae bacterium]